MLLRANSMSITEQQPQVGQLLSVSAAGCVLTISLAQDEPTLTAGAQPLTHAARPYGY
jgi:hypothetical protein